MSKVAIIGFGNVGYHLAVRISKKHEVTIFGRTPSEDIIKDINRLDTSDFEFIIVAVSDSSIKGVAESLNTSESIMLHTSGSRPISDVSFHPRHGVMYPLQTFSKDKQIDFDAFPIFIEGSDTLDKEIFSFVRSFSNDVREMSSANRIKLHLAAVFANNFTNHMYHICDKILESLGLSFAEVHHLAHETLKKAVDLTPLKSQTGPSVRNDIDTIDAHLKILEDDRWRKIYKLISEDIHKSKS